MPEKEVNNKKDVPVFIDGKAISLNATSSEHVDYYLNWLNDSRVRRFARWEMPVTREDIKKWFEPQQSRIPRHIVFELWHKKDEKPIGEVGLSDIDWINGWANVFLFIGEPKYWGKNIATEATELIIEYAFNELNFTILQAGASIDNVGSWSVAEKVGFQYRGIDKNSLYLNGEYNDGKMYRLSKQDWLNSKEKI